LHCYEAQDNYQINCYKSLMTNWLDTDLTLEDERLESLNTETLQQYQ
jgi:hypothetical protein